MNWSVSTAGLKWLMCGSFSNSHLFLSLNNNFCLLLSNWTFFSRRRHDEYIPMFSRSDSQHRMMHALSMKHQCMHNWFSKFSKLNFEANVDLRSSLNLRCSSLMNETLCLADQHDFDMLPHNACHAPRIVCVIHAHRSNRCDDHKNMSSKNWTGSNSFCVEKHAFQCESFFDACHTHDMDANLWNIVFLMSNNDFATRSTCDIFLSKARKMQTKLPPSPTQFRDTNVRLLEQWLSADGCNFDMPCTKLRATKVTQTPHLPLKATFNNSTSRAPQLGGNCRAWWHTTGVCECVRLLWVCQVACCRQVCQCGRMICHRTASHNLLVVIHRRVGFLHGILCSYSSLRFVRSSHFRLPRTSIRYSAALSFALLWADLRKPFNQQYPTSPTAVGN